jgi:hemerythrin
MALVTWNDSYSVKVQKFDAQHQQLFALINDLNDAMRVGKGRTIIRQVVGQLAHYTRVHFEEEEATMRRAAYPEIAMHRIEHQRFVADVEKFGRELDETGSANTVEVLSMLRDWLLNHIQKKDMEYSSHLNAKGIR